MSLKSEIRIIIMGNLNTGKTQFMNKWATNIFSDVYRATIVSEFLKKIIRINEKHYDIQIWNLSGNNKSLLVSKIFAKGAHGCIIMSDATDKKTREE